MKHLWLLVLAACIRTNSVACDDGSLCPEGTACTTLAIAPCVAPEQLTACADHADFADCTTSLFTGRCYSGVCLPGGCGNGIVDPEELCDDGNADFGDGCSLGCRSDEICGNGIVDPVRLVNGALVPGEDCDDANAFAHDGCQTCRTEIVRWQPVLEAIPESAFIPIAFDSIRRRFIAFDSSGMYESDGQAWSRIATLVAPPIPTVGKMVFDSRRGVVVWFGGLGTVNETWEWDGVQWQKREPLASPTARGGHAMAFDHRRGKTVLFGGNVGEVVLGDTWEYDGTTWTPIGTASDLAPSPRAYSAMTFDPISGTTFLVSGATLVIGQITVAADTWQYDGTWRLVPDSKAPGVRGHGLAFDPITKRLHLFGGAIMGLGSAQMWQFDGTRWSTVSPPPGPAPREFVGMATNPFDRISLVGMGATPGIPQHWAWGQGGWDLREPPTVPGFSQITGTFDSLRQHAVIVDNSGTWEFDGVQWLEYKDAPSARTDAAMAYDATHDRIVLAGGQGASDVWVRNGTTWTLVTQDLPPTRVGAAMAHDAERDCLVLFGGTGSGSVTATYEQCGGSGPWRAIEPVPNEAVPANRSYARMAYDPLAKRVILVGGLVFGVMGSNETWSWDGAHWTLIGSDLPGRGFHALTWSPAHQALVVHGGQDGVGGRPSDTLLFRDGRWQPLPGLPPPVIRSAHMLFPDRFGVLQMVGGYAGFSTNEPAERLRLTSVAPVPYESCTLDEDRDGDGLAGCADPDCAGVCRQCGDGSCEGHETDRICPADCTRTTICGDAICDPNEVCPGDC